MSFLRTASASGRAFLREFGWREGLPMVLHGAWEALKAAFCPESELSNARMICCLGCKMFDHSYESCGNPLEFYVDANGTRRSLGCHCYLPLAVKLYSHSCWARNHHLNFGWPDALMPKKQ